MSNPYIRDSWEWHAYEVANWATRDLMYDTTPQAFEYNWNMVFDPISYGCEGLDWPLQEFISRARVAYRDEGADATLTVMIDKLASKQRDYGPKNILAFGQDGIRIRSYDKVARIKNLVENNSQGSVEPLVDAYFDLWGYGVLSRMLQLGVFERPLQEQMLDAVSEETAADDVVRYGDKFYFRFTNDYFTDAGGHEYCVYVLERA